MIEASTFTFLKKLKNNNNRNWFTTHKNEFIAIQNDVKSFYKEVENKLNRHDNIEKFKLFRIYRDVRFSKDKTPYKTHFGGHYVRRGQQKRGGYYLHIEPGNSFIAGGFWNPNKEDLFRIRKEFETDTSIIKKIITEQNFINHFKKLRGDTLKSAPRGFDKNHPNIEFIKMKQFIVTEEFDDRIVLSSSFLNKVNESFIAMRPYFNYMSEVLTTNLNGESILE